MLSQKDQQRVQVLTQVHRGTVTVSQAAQVLRLCHRHVQRLLAGFRAHGVAALSHGNRGRAAPNRIAESIRKQVVMLARSVYAGINDHHLTDLLREQHALKLSRPTVFRVLREAGVPRPRTRRPPRHRRRRPRMPHPGLLVQLDGSHHPWLGPQGPHFVLLAAIDDATSRVLGAVFRPHEDAHGYFLLLSQVLRRYGVPAAVYTDRHGIFRREARTGPSIAAQLADTPRLTQIGRALHTLGIRWIPASSPQGKGRVERLFGTLQDRLVQELRLADARTLDDANALLRTFLPRFNRRFAQAPAQRPPAFRPCPSRTVLETTLCFKYPRTVANDNTVRVGPHLLQLSPGPGGRSYAKAHVYVLERLDGTFAVQFRDAVLSVRHLTPPPVDIHLLRARRNRPLQSPDSRPTAPPIPAAPLTPPPSPPPRDPRPGPDHPWRQYAQIARRKELSAQGVTFSLNR
ncbi:MAG TPA: ISNCY family transposase [bacterium]|nr:ISNCY family transposase [bacterium]